MAKSLAMNPIVDFLLLGSASGNENETVGDMCIECLHVVILDFEISCVCLRKSSDLLLHILVSHLQSKFIGSGLVKNKNKQIIRTWFWSDRQ